MPDTPRHNAPTTEGGPFPAASARLRSYLAANDVTCTGCGYQLRGVTSALCPECGCVIPAPPAERRTSEMAIRCHRCGYMLHGLSSGQCPECGATDVKLSDIEARMAQRRRRRVPLVLGMCAAGGLLLGLWRLWMLLYLTPLPPALSGQRILLSLPLCAAPLAIAVVVYRRPSLIRGEGEGTTFARRAVVSCVGVVLLTIALALT